ncbi:unnamed protein product [Camellia sinensis]
MVWEPIQINHWFVKNITNKQRALRSHKHPLAFTETESPHPILHKSTRGEHKTSRKILTKYIYFKQFYNMDATPCHVSITKSFILLKSHAMIFLKTHYRNEFKTQIRGSKYDSGNF